MAKYELTNKAVADLNGIWEYTFENWSENQADRYYDYQALQLISTIDMRIQGSRYCPGN